SIAAALSDDASDMARVKVTSAIASGGPIASKEAGSGPRESQRGRPSRSCDEEPSMKPTAAMATFAPSSGHRDGTVADPPPRPTRNHPAATATPRTTRTRPPRTAFFLGAAAFAFGFALGVPGELTGANGAGRAQGDG